MFTTVYRTNYNFRYWQGTFLLTVCIYFIFSGKRIVFSYVHVYYEINLICCSVKLLQKTLMKTVTYTPIIMYKLKTF